MYSKQKNIRPFKGIYPRISNLAFIDASAVVIGDCEINNHVSIWANATLRGDMNKIKIGAYSNIQDNCILHNTHRSKFSKASLTEIGSKVTVGHGCILHGCQIENNCLIGIGSIILDHAVIENNIIIGAGSLVSAHKKLVSGYMYYGSPVKQIRKLTDEELEYIDYAASNYAKLKDEYR